jgi:hypothetical protein
MRTLPIANRQLPICLRAKRPSFQLEMGDWRLEIKR